MIDDPFEILSAVVRSRYLAMADLPKVPFWNRLPVELQNALNDAIAAKAGLNEVAKTTLKLRVTMFGDPLSRSDDTQNEFVFLMLGLIYLSYREGRIGWDELLARAFHIGDSYLVRVGEFYERHGGAPFAKLRHELSDRDFIDTDEARIDSLFEPYRAIAKKHVELWGLKIA